MSTFFNTAKLGLALVSRLWSSLKNVAAAVQQVLYSGACIEDIQNVEHC